MANLHKSIIQPQTSKHFDSRNRLLQKTLRDSDSPMAVEDEYPLALSQYYRQNSFCIANDEQEIIAHSNLVIRDVINTDNLSICKVGLIGNVASSPKFRGQGLIRDIFDHIKNLAISKNLDALLLWSDLTQFYQKMDFKSLGQENRFDFRSTLPQITENSQIKVFMPDDLTEKTLQELLKLRPNTPLTLKRTSEEFALLLTIPATFLFIATLNERIIGYAIIGRGMDLQGVMHEWGANSPVTLHQMIQSILKESALDEILLLAPHEGEGMAEYSSYFSKLNVPGEKHPLAWYLPLKAETQPLEHLFVWGMDSI
jgi:N-acetylglutamate synthase-like GNAT family acetyltransferase